jgi:ribosomal protein L24
VKKIKKKENKKKKLTKTESPIEYEKVWITLLPSERKKLDRYAKKYHVTRCEMLNIAIQIYIDKHTGKTKTGGITKQNADEI